MKTYVIMVKSSDHEGWHIDSETDLFEEALIMSHDAMGTYCTNRVIIFKPVKIKIEEISE